MIAVLASLFGTVLPIAAVALLMDSNDGSEGPFDERKKRSRPLLVVSGIYFLGAALLYVADAPIIIFGLMFCYFSNTMIVYLINKYWKVSIHAMGVAGPTTALIFAFGPLGAVYAVLLPIVMWARLELDKHTDLQVIVGSTLGFALTGLQLHLFCSYFSIDATGKLLYVFLSIYAFVGPAIVLSSTGRLNQIGYPDGYTRKIFHFIAFFSITVYFNRAPLNLTYFFIAAGALYVGTALLSRDDFLWLRGIARSSDAPYQRFYVVSPLISSLAGITIGNILFSTGIISIGLLCVALADAIAEPVGVKFGRHRYEIRSLAGDVTQRSIEGSLSIAVLGFIIVFLFRFEVLPSVIVGLGISSVEAISPRGTDNFTVMMASSGLLSLIP